MHGHPLHERDRQDVHRGEKFPTHRGGRPIQSSSNLTYWRTGSKPSRYILSLCQGERETRATTSYREKSFREVTTNSECSCVACQRRDRSHATTVRPSIAARFRSSPPQKIQTAFLASYDTTFSEQTYIPVVLHRPVETTRVTGQVQPTRPVAVFNARLVSAFPPLYDVTERSADLAPRLSG